MSGIIAPNLCLGSSLLSNLRWPENIILLDYLFLRQSDLDEVLANYTKLRDFYNMNTSALLATVMVAKIIADVGNASLVSINNVGSTCHKEFFDRTPSLHLYVYGQNLIDIFKNTDLLREAAKPPLVIQRCAKVDEVINQICILDVFSKSY